MGWDEPPRATVQSCPVPWCRVPHCAHLAVIPSPRSPPVCTVMPTIEKLLSSDWKERLLGRNTAESKEVKGEGHVPARVGFVLFQPKR